MDLAARIAGEARRSHEGTRAHGVSEERTMPKLAVAIVVQVAFLASASFAQDTQPTFDVHGVGGWSYGKTNENVYLSGSPDGNYSETAFDTNVVGTVSDRLRIVGQIGF